MHINNKGKDILILSKGPTQGLNNTTLTAETLYPVNFTRPGITVCLSQHYNGSNSFVFDVTKIYQFKAKDSEIKKYPLCLANTSGDFSANNMIKTGLNGYVYNFSVDYNITDISNIIDVHKYLMKK